MRNILKLMLVIAVLAVLILDGASMWMAYQLVHEVAGRTAEEATVEYVASHGNEAAAKQAATSYARSREVDLVSIEYHQGQSGGRWFEAEVKAEAPTRVFRFIPLLNRLLVQEASGIAQF